VAGVRVAGVRVEIDLKLGKALRGPEDLASTDNTVYR